MMQILGKEAHEIDIVAVVGDRKTVALFNTLRRLPQSSARYQARGSQARCFYASQSSQGLRLGAYVSIIAGPDDEELEDCVWEEMLHTLGPLRDANGSAFFSFDNTATLEDRAGRRANDLLLIRALYESGAGPGCDPEVVLEHLGQLLR